MEIELDVQGERDRAALEKFAAAIAYLYINDAPYRASWIVTDYLMPALERKFPDKTDSRYIEGKKHLEAFSDAMGVLSARRVVPPSPQWKLKV